jgi:hypothetical protein
MTGCCRGWAASGVGVRACGPDNGRSPRNTVAWFGSPLTSHGAAGRIAVDLGGHCTRRRSYSAARTTRRRIGADEVTADRARWSGSPAIRPHPARTVAPSTTTSFRGDSARTADPPSPRVRVHRRQMIGASRAIEKIHPLAIKWGRFRRPTVLLHCRRSTRTIATLSLSGQPTCHRFVRSPPPPSANDFAFSAPDGVTHQRLSPILSFISIQLHSTPIQYRLQHRLSLANAY